MDEILGVILSFIAIKGTETVVTRALNESFHYLACCKVEDIKIPSPPESTHMLKTAKI